MSQRIGIVRFLGTNCDRDIWQAVQALGKMPVWLWYNTRVQWKDFHSIIIPGGFSYGDYLRTGAMAAKTPIMQDVVEAADKGVPVLGICNGFQILCEAGLLPGVLVRNSSLRFVSEWTGLKMINTNPKFGWTVKTGSSFKLPIQHGEGRYYAEDRTIRQLEDGGQIWLKYTDNPNGSLGDIAGIMNKEKNVAGLMPHPERAMFDWMGSEIGKSFFM